MSNGSPKPPWRDFLETETDAGYFIRGHLAIHNQISALLKVYLGQGLLTHTSFNLLQTFELAVAIHALPDGLRPLIRGINAIRNRLAHKIDSELDLDTAMKLFNESGSDFQECFGNNAHVTSRQVVSFLFQFTLHVIDKRIASTIARRERTSRKLLETQKTRPEIHAAFEAWWKQESDPSNPDLLALERQVYAAMSSMSFPLPDDVDFTLAESDDETDSDLENGKAEPGGPPV